MAAFATQKEFSQLQASLLQVIEMNKELAKQVKELKHELKQLKDEISSMNKDTRKIHSPNRYILYSVYRHLAYQFPPNN